jgi:hypothetical protein
VPNATSIVHQTRVALYDVSVDVIEGFNRGFMSGVIYGVVSVVIDDAADACAACSVN